MQSVKGRIGEDELDRYRSLNCTIALPLLADYVKEDKSFTPIKDGHTHRWLVNAGGRDFELLTNGPKWFDTRANRGGGGAVDLAIHLFRLDFKQAVAKIRTAL